MKRYKLLSVGILGYILFLALFISQTTSASITKGPYIQNLKKDGITICWESSTLSNTTVEVASSDTIYSSKTISIQAKPGFFGEVNVSGLSPSTKYVYRIIQENGNSDGGTFTTAPDTTIPFRFAAYGDSRTNHKIHSKIIEQMETYNPVLILNSGDLIENGKEQKHWNEFFKITNSILKNIPLYPAPGNHEQDSSLYFNYFSLPRNGDNERYYSFSYSNVLFIVLDSNAPYYMLAAQKDFLKKELSQSRSFDFRVVMFHHPLYSSSRREPNISHRNIYLPIFKKYKVDLVLNGHDHFYERSEDGSGIEFVITGGGGAPLYGFEKNNPENKVKNMVHHFMIIDVNGPVMKASAIDIDGKVFDEFTIQSKTSNLLK